MVQKKRVHTKEKSKLHIRNKHRERYNFKELISAYPDLEKFVILNSYNDESIDFFDPRAVLSLNKALLKFYYNVDNWNIPQNYLCPPIPGRADYIHNIADLLSISNQNKIPIGTKVKCLDVGVGANCVYPLIGNSEYSWSFVGSEIDPIAIHSANNIIESNQKLLGLIEIRKQANPSNIFSGVIRENELFDVVICNPPFHSSAAEAQSASIRKIKNLKGKKNNKPVLNFGGKNTELWCVGGEKKFILNMIRQSEKFSDSCFWFTTLVSKQSNLDRISKELESANIADTKIIEMGQGNKISRIVAWTFLSKDDQEKWVLNRWENKE